MSLRRIALVALVAPVAVAAAACADAPGPGDGAGSPSDASGDPTQLLLRWGYEGGFTPPEFQLTNLPAFSLYADGTIVRPGPQIEIYPGPALPALESIVVDEAGIDAIIDAAFDADLDTVDDLTDMGSVAIADAPETVFTLRASGVDRTVRVYALGELGGQPPLMPDHEYEARRRLLDLVDQLSSLESWLPDGSIGASTVFEPAGVRAFVAEYRGKPDLPQPKIGWPLSAPLATIGDDAGAGLRCVSVTGAEWTVELQPVARSANQLTPWTSRGERYAVSFRPMLPDETTC